ncbi:3-dehydroquinate synthase [Chroococcidiopsis sp. CCNUC1]|uniref:3-dehydroquinate synthase n=1 Tax=Chroococcidiopsis sp. CCNUC1 TaxID=2653189 RepID=UPI002020AF33|nr:3-dehydroquinate synthase [Chroococcidiopsis sp. CCNUC1]URD47905.1 3-dehydroquinate synthase [Chroococcidiopsis sp. CCNUC1]
MILEIQRQTNYSLQPIHQRVSVTFRYQVHFTKGLFQLDNPLLARVMTASENSPKQAIAIVDAGLVSQHQDLIAQLSTYARRYNHAFQLAAVKVVAGGEATKNDPQAIEQIQQLIHQTGLCRHSYVLAIGGGAVLDMAGYAAATAHRGIRLIRVPTTVLAQNDSGVGVKNGINAFGKKNFLGTFAPPYAVLNDCDFLYSLDDRDWRSGIAEAIKVALIKDASFFDAIASSVPALVRRDMDAMQQLIYRCAQLHLEHIANSGDPFEMGSSRPLDFGHWAAHKLEQLTDYSLRHGEAVAIGIALDSTYSYLLGLLSRGEWQQILDLLEALGFALYVPQMRQDCLFQGLTEFREHLGGELTLMLLQALGQGIEVHEVDPLLYGEAIAILADRSRE